MTKDEIKKALECCIKGDCCDCPYYDGCTQELTTDALNLITEQEKEIERLKAENKQSNVSKILGNNVIVEFHDDIISEQPVVSIDSKDFEKYAKSFRNRIISIDETIKKQAKIEVLNELKTRHDYAIKNMGYPWDISQQIDEMIEELEK